MAEWLTQRELAARIHRTTQQVQNLVSKGLPVDRKEKAPRYDWEVVGPWWEEELKRQGARERRPGPESSARSRKLEVEARRAELELAEFEEQLVTVEDFDVVFGNVLDRLRKVILNIPGRYAARIDGVRGMNQATQRLEAIAMELLETLSRAADENPEDHDNGGKAGRARGAARSRTGAASRPAQTAA